MRKSNIFFLLGIGFSMILFYLGFLESKWFYDKTIFLGEHTIISLQYGFIASILFSISFVGLLIKWDSITEPQNRKAQQTFQKVEDKHE